MVLDLEDSQNHLQTTNQTCYRTWITEEHLILFIFLIPFLGNLFRNIVFNDLYQRNKHLLRKMCLIPQLFNVINFTLKFPEFHESRLSQRIL
ncbi:hypothetical protein CLV82_1074 [Zeaxanthinibacter enoshimensis]|uniref:Uncharacterized protein n=1 Tax=Zeaxanthinibacter enoshimensis TaxID=392009 RepID=A0A4R6TRQ6_9FLAO|nr:hypothetical protein CLV82_1074 [Zeaxanthinibacter enoshimensis]